MVYYKYVTHGCRLLIPNLLNIYILNLTGCWEHTNIIQKDGKDLVIIISHKTAGKLFIFSSPKFFLLLKIKGVDGYITTSDRVRGSSTMSFIPTSAYIKSSFPYIVPVTRSLPSIKPLLSTSIPTSIYHTTYMVRASSFNPTSTYFKKSSSYIMTIAKSVHTVKSPLPISTAFYIIPTTSSHVITFKSKQTISPLIYIIPSVFFGFIIGVILTLIYIKKRNRRRQIITSVRNNSLLLSNISNTNETPM